MTFMEIEGHIIHLEKIVRLSNKSCTVYFTNGNQLQFDQASYRKITNALMAAAKVVQ